MPVIASSVDVPTSSTVGHSASPTTVVTGRKSFIDSPRFPCKS